MDVVAARRRFLGDDVVDGSGDVDPDRLVLSWFGVAGFVVAIGGHVLLLDAWVPRGLHAGYVPTSPEALAALEPDAILVGHGHLDHAGDLDTIARRCSALVVGSPDHVGRTRPGRLAVSAIPGDATEVAVADGLTVTAVGHVHSGLTLPDRTDAGGLHAPAVAAPDLRPLLRHPPTPRSLLHLARHLADDEGGCLLYLLRAGDVTVAWHDTSGPLTERAPHVLDALGRSAPVTVHIGALHGPNQLTNGLRDPRRYVEALRPEVLVPCHHDNWLPGLTTSGARWERLLIRELERLPADVRPRVAFLRDPDDYCRPIEPLRVS